MWRIEREGCIVRDEWFGAVTSLGLTCVLFIVMALSRPETNFVMLAIALAGLVLTATWRRRIEIDRKSARLRVSWGFAVSPNLPALTLRVSAERPVAEFVEVLLERSQQGPEGIGACSIHLMYRRPERRHDFELARLSVGLFSGRGSGVEAAAQFGADLGLAVRTA